MRFSITAKMPRKSCISLISTFLLFLFFVCDPLNAIALKTDDVFSSHRLITREKRRSLALTDSGQISAVEIDDGYRGPYHLQFITMEPSSLFLPVMLQTDMVFYVHSGRGQLTYHDGEGKRDQVEIERGDIFRIGCGSVFYVQSYSNPTREKLRIFAIFTSKINENIQLEYFGAYSKISDLVLGFDERVLQVAFKVSEEEMKGITMAKKLPPIVRMSKNTENDKFDWREGIIQALVGGSSHSLDNKKGKAFNILKVNPDVKNCNGWSLAVTSKDFHALKGSDVGAFMVNLTKGSMMGPHWNPRATEIAVVLQGQGMVSVVCPSDATQCKNARFRVKEGDVFTVPRFHPMAQISFNNDSLVFMGFSTMARNNRPQFLAGKWSVHRTIDEDILAMSFDVSNTTIKHFISAQSESVILECASCAEYEEKKMEEDIEKEEQEEKGRQQEEQEEEARKKEKEEEARRREEEEARKKEKEEEARRREEEEARKKEKEEEARRREEEEARKRHEEEEARKREAARKREEEEREIEQEEASKQEEEREARQKEEKEARKREEERGKEQEKARKQEEERETRRKEEKEAWKREEEEREKEQEGASKQEEERVARRKEEKEARKREEEERGKEQEKARKQEEERETRRKEEKEAWKRGEEEREKEQEGVRKQEEEREARRKEEKEARKREEEEETRMRDKEWKEEEGRREEKSREEEKRQKEKKREKEWVEEAARREEEKREEGKGGGGGGGWKSLKSVF